MAIKIPNIHQNTILLTEMFFHPLTNCVYLFLYAIELCLSLFNKIILKL